MVPGRSTWKVLLAVLGGRTIVQSPKDPGHQPSPAPPKMTAVAHGPFNDGVRRVRLNYLLWVVTANDYVVSFTFYSEIKGECIVGFSHSRHWWFLRCTGRGGYLPGQPLSVLLLPSVLHTGGN